MDKSKIMNHYTNNFSAFLIALFVFNFSTITHLKAQIDRESGPSISTRSEIIAQRGMVATSQPLATQIGLQILKNGEMQSMPLLQQMQQKEIRRDGP